MKLQRLSSTRELQLTKPRQGKGTTSKYLFDVVNAVIHADRDAGGQPLAIDFASAARQCGGRGRAADDGSHDGGEVEELVEEAAAGRRVAAKAHGLGDASGKIGQRVQGRAVLERLKRPVQSGREREKSRLNSNPLLAFPSYSS